LSGRKGHGKRPKTKGDGDDVEVPHPAHPNARHRHGRRLDRRLDGVGGVTRPPDVRDAASSIVTAYLGSPPDIRDVRGGVASASLAVPDVLERYVAAHPYGAGLPQATGRSPASASTDVVRPPDVADAAQAARTFSVGQAGGFDWSDYGIGIGSGIGISLLLAGGLALGRQRRRMQTA
jgi:hypothetical protein